MENYTFTFIIPFLFNVELLQKNWQWVEHGIENLEVAIYAA